MSDTPLLQSDTHHPDEEALFPIREVSRQTGVNSVTLRAWERRYGLIKPLRTSKGHRLYSTEHVTRVQCILEWLDRGVAISRVRELLDRPEPAAALVDDTDNTWQLYFTQMHTAVKSFNENRLDDALNQALALYPVESVVQRLIQPLLTQLQQEWLNLPVGAALEKQFLFGYLRTKLGMRLFHANRTQPGKTLLLAGLTSDTEEVELLLQGAIASALGFRVISLGTAIPIREIPLALDHTQADALLLHSDQRLDRSMVLSELPRLRQLYPHLAIAMHGHCSQIHQQAFAELAIQTSTEAPHLLMRKLLQPGS